MNEKRNSKEEEGSSSSNAAAGGGGDQEHNHNFHNNLNEEEKQELQEHNNQQQQQKQEKLKYMKKDSSLRKFRPSIRSNSNSSANRVRTRRSKASESSGINSESQSRVDDFSIQEGRVYANANAISSNQSRRLAASSTPGAYTTHGRAFGLNVTGWMRRSSRSNATTTMEESERSNLDDVDVSKIIDLVMYLFYFLLIYFYF